MHATIQVIRKTIRKVKILTREAGNRRSPHLLSFSKSKLQVSSSALWQPTCLSLSSPIPRSLTGTSGTPCFSPSCGTPRQLTFLSVSFQYIETRFTWKPQRPHLAESQKHPFTKKMQLPHPPKNQKG